MSSPIADACDKWLASKPPPNTSPVHAFFAGAQAAHRYWREALKALPAREADRLIEILDNELKETTDGQEGS